VPPSDNLLIFADTERDADLLYAVGMFVPDPFIYLRLRGRECVVMSDLEIDRARRQIPHCRILSLANQQAKVRAAGSRKAGYAEVIRAILRDRRVGSVLVPVGFPLGLARQLEQLGVRVRPKSGTFFEQREQKSAREVGHLRAALRMAEAGMAQGIGTLRRSRAGRDGRLMFRSAPLTSERLRAVIDTAILQEGGVAGHTIVAGGKQGCDPHEPGHGPLLANEPIILDIFPRAQATGYFGDITRTVVRGRASEAVRRLYDTVFQGQRLAFRRVRAGVPTAEVHRTVQAHFERQGYKTGRRAGRMEGFFHGTGHGLGLEIHEAPRLGAASAGVLKPGQVVTVEPGLYYPGIGGVRLEDVAVVTDGAPRNLTRFEKVLEI
jgi:Xaa-Pro aminopeptidase